MKKALSFAVIFLIITLLYQFIIVLLENGHEVSYEIIASKREFFIEETYKKNSIEDGYFLKIETEDKEYVYYLENNYNKRKRIVTDIITYEKDNYLCIYPITLKDENTIEILCSDGDELYSYDYLNSKVDISKFLTSLNIANYYRTNTLGQIKENNQIFYSDNLYDDEYLSVYRYSYFTVFHQKDYRTYVFADKDIYKNEMSVYLGEKTMVPIYKKEHGITDYLLIDTKKKTTEEINLGTAISQNSYTVGTIENKIYVFDFDNKILIEIGTDDKVSIIGSVEKGFKKYVNGEWVSASITEFTQDKITFNKKEIKVNLKWSYDEIFETKKYFYIRDGLDIYKVYKKDLDVRIKILELKGAYNNIQVEDERIYYINDKYLYRYDKFGIDLLVENNEFKYNETEMYHVYIDPMEE